MQIRISQTEKGFPPEQRTSRNMSAAKASAALLP